MCSQTIFIPGCFIKFSGFQGWMCAYIVRSFYKKSKKAAVMLDRELVKERSVVITEYIRHKSQQVVFLEHSLFLLFNIILLKLYSIFFFLF